MDLLTTAIQHIRSGTKWDGRLLASVVPQEEFAKLVSLTSISLGFIVEVRSRGL